MTSASTLESWRASTARWAADHDLTTPDGRAAFRVHLAAETRRTRVTLLCEAAEHLGARNAPGSRHGAQRALADIVITRELIARRRAETRG